MSQTRINILSSSSSEMHSRYTPSSSTSRCYAKLKVQFGDNNFGASATIQSPCEILLKSQEEQDPNLLQFKYWSKEIPLPSSVSLKITEKTHFWFTKPREKLLFSAKGLDMTEALNEIKSASKCYR